MIVNPNDSKKIATLNRLIDLGVRRLASEHPEAFVPDTEHLVLLADHTDGSASLTIATTADPYVLQWSGTSSTFSPQDDGTWNGVYNIEVTDAGGTVHRRVCREFWPVYDLLGVLLYWRVSVTQPITTFAGTGFAWRLYMPAFYTTADVVRILDGMLFVDNPMLMVALPRKSFLQNQRIDYKGSQNGRPVDFWRSDYHQIDAPTRAPQAAVTGNSAWGPEPIGTFDYCFTYCWGARSPDERAPGGSLVPLWESTPSPVSNVVVVPDAGSIVTVTIPEVAWMVNFNTAGTLRQGHSGIYKRLYRRRSVTGAIPGHSTIEAPNVFQFLADIDDTVTSYVDNGSVIPDYYTRLPESQGYYAWVPWPHQDHQYVVDLHVERQPRKLENDSDAPKVQASHNAMLLELIAAEFAKNDNDAAGAQRHEMDYQRLARDYAKQQENPSSFVPAQPWGQYQPAVRFNRVTSGT